MNRNSQWYNILSKIEECRRELDYLVQQKTNLPLIEVDIVLNKLSLLYDTLMTIKLQAAANEETGFLTRNSSLINKIIKESVFNNEEQLPISENQNQLSKSSVDLREERLSTNDKQSKTMNIPETKEITNASEQTISAISAEPKTIKTVADTYANTKKTLAERMEEIYKKKDLSTQQLKSIKDLRNAISINDKIMFIRELFNNNVENYNYVIEQINACVNLDEALAILDKNIKIQADSQAVNQLLELVYRRFMN